MNGQNSDSYFLFTTDVLSKEQFFKQKRQAIAFTEQLIQSKSLSYISEIFSCFPINGNYLQQLDADMRRLSIICRILVEEKQSAESKLYFLEQVDSFDDLMQKYIRIKFFLRRLEFPFSEKVLKEAIAMLMDEQISIFAVREILNYEAFADKEIRYKEVLKIKAIGGFLK